jgi:archaellum component FlaC
MSIELLYIIPIIALVVFTFSISYVAQKRSMTSGQGKLLDVEVRQFNKGDFISQAQTTESRLDEFDHTIASINKALANQQKVIETFQEENNRYNDEIDTLKKKLRELHKEHDIVVSENYSLRAKYNNLVKTSAPEAQLSPGARLSEPDPAVPQRTAQPAIAWERGMSVLDETKPFSTNILDDTSIIDLSDMFK